MVEDIGRRGEAREQLLCDWFAVDRGPTVERRVAATAAAAAIPRTPSRTGVRDAWRPPVIPRWSTTATSVDDEGRSGQAHQTHRMLLLGAAQCFATGGFGGASVSDILAETGRVRGRAITKGAFYAHFDSKHDVARSVVEEACASWAGVADRSTGRGTTDPLWDLLAAVDASTGMAMYDPVARGAWRLRLDHEDFAATLARADVCEAERMAGMLRRARDLDLLRDPVDPTRAVDHLVTLFAGHRARTEAVGAEAAGPGVADLWDRMTTTWRHVLPAIVVEPWLAGWRRSGWPRRPRPVADAYRRARSLASVR